MSEISEAKPGNTENDTAPAEAAKSAKSTVTTPASSVTGVPISKLKAPTNFGGSTGAMSKIGRPCAHAAPKAGPPPRDTNSMSRESDDNLSSINSTYTDMYQETVKRFTRSSLSPEMDRYSPSRISIKSNSTSQRSSSDAADRRTSYQGAVLTFDTEQFIIGQRVWVGGIRPGQIAYIGETHFAPGDWAGIVLDEPNGKNDGCVSGKRYFQCEPRRGIFSRLTRLTMAPMTGACTTPTSPLSKFSPERSRTVSPTASIRSSFMRSPGKNGLTVGDRIIVSSGFGSRPGILRYLGETQFASGNWCGIELDDNTGKNDGSVDGIKYFECKPKYGVFVPIAKVSLSPSSKKTPRLSRTGSRESLTSIGTMNSIATTNTSRMRMSAQRKPSSASFKSVTTPKSQFSMQDQLREKQNHIEQLMIERDLDREDAQNQALQLQKNISELKSRISHLERKLEDERKKTEDLQFSIDEATFCGDELNAQTQVYKEKIHDLERKITDFSTGAPNLQTPLIPPDNTAADEQVAELTIQLNEQSLQNQLFEARLTEGQDEEKRLLENIKYLQTENESLQKELLDKDESLEKFSLSESGIDNLRRELALLKDENEKERTTTHASFKLKLEEKTSEVKRLTEEMTAIKNSLGTLESDHTNKEDECEILRNECRNRDEQLMTLNEQLAKMNAELSVQKAESSTLDELLKVQQAGSVQGKSALEERLAEICKLKEEISGLQTAKATLEANLQVAAEELKKLAEMQKTVEQKLQAASSADQEKRAAMNKLESVMEELNKHVVETSAENEKLNVELKNSTETNVNVKAAVQSLRIELEEKEKLCMIGNVELKSAKEMVTTLENDLSSLEAQSKQTLASKAQDIERLTSEISKLQEKTKTLEGQSSTTVQQMSTKISDLEAIIKTQSNKLQISGEEIELQRQERIKQEQIVTEKHTALQSTTTTLESVYSEHNKLKQEHEHTLTKYKELEEQMKKSDNLGAQQQLELGDLTRKLEISNIKCESLAAQIETLHQDILAARTSGSEVQNEVRKLNEEIAVRQKAFSELQSQSNDERMRFESQNEQLNQKLMNAVKDFDELKVTLHKTREELSKKSEQITLLEEKTIKQELSLSDALRQSENLQTKYDALAAQNASMQYDLTSVRTSSTDSNAEILKLSQDIAVKQKSYEELLDKTGGERSTLEGQLQASQQRVDTLCSQVETLTQELKGTTDESFKRFEQLKHEQEKSGKQELELSDLTRKFETLNTKCESFESQNENLQKDLTSLRTASNNTNGEVLKLAEAISSKQKALQELTDRTSADRLQRENQLQELTQQLQASQSEVESLQNDLKWATESKAMQAAEFESLKAELQSITLQELVDVKAREAAERQKLVENFEAHFKIAEQTKITLDEAISSLQKQIQLLQDELLKSQLDFRSKEEELSKQITAYSAEKAHLSSTLAQVQSEGTTTLSSVQHEKAELMQRLQMLAEELKAKEQQLQSSNSEAEQLKLQQSNTSSELTQFATKVNSLESALDLSRAEVEHKVKLAIDDQRKIEDLKSMLEAVQTSNANISATNAGLAEALQLLEQEKCETANIFELFEMETDQNAEQLIDKLSNMKQELAASLTQLLSKDAALADAEESLQSVNAELQASQSALDAAQSSVLQYTTKLAELSEANAEMSAANAVKETQLREHEDLQFQLAEYKKTVDEMDDDSMHGIAKVTQLEERVRELELERHQTLESQKALKLENTNIQRKFESMDSEKTRELVALQGRIKELESFSKPNQNGAGDILGKAIDDSGDDSTAQINFLNSIIADMQKKNETLKAKIEALEALPMDFTKPSAFDLISRRKPAPRVFCDICDEFDKHETEDCPLQASDDLEFSPTPSTETNNNDPANKKERKLPEPRKYCESCEVFGHDTGECDDECF